MDNNVNDVIQLPSLVYRLCAKHLGNLNKEDVSKLYALSFQLLRAPKTNLGDCEELYLLAKIKENLSREFRDSESLRIEELYHKLKRVPTICRNPSAFLEFLYHLSPKSNSVSGKQSSLHLLNNGLVIPNTLQPLHSSTLSNCCSHQTNGVNSKAFFNSYQDMAKLLPTGSLDNDQLMSSRSPTRQQQRKARSNRPHTIHVDGLTSAQFVSEKEIIREILFAFQGLNGKILTTDASKEGLYAINPQYYISASNAKLVLRLTNLGWLFNRINKYCVYISKEKSCGHVCQSFASALHDEILDYYRLITVIEEKLHDNDNELIPNITLHQLQHRSFETHYRFKILASLVEQCKTKKGGALASVIYKNMQTGDPLIKFCLTKILNQVLLPIRRMLSQWIFHGELEDNYREFFISTNRAGVTQMSPISATFWHDRYVINKDMLPGFISKEQADKILSTGKAIYMLHQVCRNQVTAYVPGYSDLKQSFEDTNLESLFNRKRAKDGKTELHHLLETAYQEISRTSLTKLNENYKLNDHFRGLRQYMLLGQGDFVRHLMDMLSGHLSRPANKLVRHAIVQILESAIRSTNAQFDDHEILNRIDIMLTPSAVDNETGWDIFSLTYRIDGPIHTIFTNESQKLYPKLFKHLWRSKRMEYVLTDIWKNLVCFVKFEKKIPSLRSVYQSFHMLVSEMMHFTRQMQYYLTFDVIECQWTRMQTELNNPRDVDHLIKAHSVFLENVFKQSLLDESTEEIYLQYRAICDYVLEFETHIENFCKATECEIRAREKFDKNIKDNETKGKWSILSTEDKVEEERRSVFENDTIPKARSWMAILSRNYRDNVHKFLVMLADDQEKELQELSARLDFNEHYKKRDKRLETSFTFASHHSRQQRLSMDTSISK